jgi:hypothetical protein
MKIQDEDSSIALKTDFSGSYAELRRLWASVILQAIADMDCNQKIDGKTASSIRMSAREWLNSDSDDIASCQWICEILDLDHKRLIFKCNSREGRREIRFPKKNENKNQKLRQ